MTVLRRMGNVARLGFGWMMGWGAIGACISMIVGVVDPPSIGPGEGPADLFRILGGVGAGSGIVFGLLLMAGERRRTLGEVSLLRAAFWGAVAGAALPLLTNINDSVLANTIPLGVLSALASIALARMVLSSASPIATTTP